MQNDPSCSPFLARIIAAHFRFSFSPSRACIRKRSENILIIFDYGTQIDAIRECAAIRFSRQKVMGKPAAMIENKGVTS